MRVFEASAPGRAGIIGNPSDIYGGVVVSCSVPARARCRLTLGTGEERFPEDRRLWDAALNRFPIGGLDKSDGLDESDNADSASVEWTTEIPRSSGISGSTALLAATLACVLAARGEAHRLEDKVAFAELLRDIERHDAGIVCGYQDAYMIVHGGLQRMDFAGKRPDDPGTPARLRPIGADLPFLLVTTGVERLSGAVHGPMAERWMKGERAVIDGMERIADLGRAGAEALSHADWPQLAALMKENHQIIAALGGSGNEIDDLIQACGRNGAMAAKLAGAGLGGTVIALTHDPVELEHELRSEGYRRFMRPQIAPGLRLEDL
ncbi:MAG: mevalonate kinase [Fimbriimonadales bacterium]